MASTSCELGLVTGSLVLKDELIELVSWIEVKIPSCEVVPVNGSLLLAVRENDDLVGVMS